MEIWERQPGETDAMWRPFEHYRNAGPSRTLARSADALGLSTSRLEQLSSRWKWQLRVRAYDMGRDRTLQQAMLRARNAMLARHASMAQRIQQSFSTLLQTVDPEAVGPADAARIVEAAMRLEREARAMADREVKDLETLRPWDLRPGESDAAHAAFRIWAAIPPETRSIPNAIRETGVEPTSARLSQWRQYSARYRWTVRGAAWDAYKAAMTDEACIEYDKRIIAWGSKIAADAMEAWALDDDHPQRYEMARSAANLWVTIARGRAMLAGMPTRMRVDEADDAVRKFLSDTTEEADADDAQAAQADDPSREVAENG